MIFTEMIFMFTEAGLVFIYLSLYIQMRELLPAVIRSVLLVLVSSITSRHREQSYMTVNLFFNK